MIYLTIALLAQTALIAFLLVDRRVERREQVREREMLHQRFQAPEVAVQQHAIQAAAQPTPVPLGLEDNERFNLSREEMVEQLEAMDR